MKVCGGHVAVTEAYIPMSTADTDPLENYACKSSSGLNDIVFDKSP